MARIRTIKPDFFTSDTVSELPIRARLTWIGLWTHCDDHGRCRNNVKLVKAAVWPLDNVSLRDIEEDLAALRSHGLIFTYEVAGKSYIQVTSWTEHQRVDRPSKSPIPPPDGDSRNSREPLANSRESTGHTHPVDNPNYGEYPQDNPDSRDSREHVASPREGLDLEGKGKEGKGGEGTREPVTALLAVDNSTSEPPLKCPEHLKVQNPPACGQCKDARRAHLDWLAAKNARITASPRCQVHPSHRGQPANNCSHCSADLKAGQAA